MARRALFLLPALAFSAPLALAPALARVPESPPVPPPALVLVPEPPPDLPPDPPPRPEPCPPSGGLRVVPGGRSLSTRGLRRVRFSIEVDGGLGHCGRRFARAVEETLSDKRSWRGRGQLAVRRVARGPVDFRVVLARPVVTDRLCAPLRTNGIYSCFQRGRAVINSFRWRRGAEAYDRRLGAYRRYLVNHEVGHALGHGHASCAARGARAPVMMQQTKGVGACRPSPWPFP